MNKTVLICNKVLFYFSNYITWPLIKIEAIIQGAKEKETENTNWGKEGGNHFHYYMRVDLYLDLLE